MKSKIALKFKSFEDAVVKTVEELPLDANLAVADFEKIQNSQISHICFNALDKFILQEKKWPQVWNLPDAKKFVDIAKAVAKGGKVADEELKDDSSMVRLFYLFSF